MCYLLVMLSGHHRRHLKRHRDNITNLSRLNNGTIGKKHPALCSDSGRLKTVGRLSEVVKCRLITASPEQWNSLLGIFSQPSTLRGNQRDGTTEIGTYLLSAILSLMTWVSPQNLWDQLPCLSIYYKVSRLITMLPFFPVLPWNLFLMLLPVSICQYCSHLLHADAARVLIRSVCSRHIRLDRSMQQT